MKEYELVQEGITLTVQMDEEEAKNRGLKATSRSKVELATSPTAGIETATVDGPATAATISGASGQTSVKA